MPIDVKPMPGLEHLPFAEVWFHAIDEQAWREASRAALVLGKSGRAPNETRLAGMLALNRRLGYRLLYTEIVLRGPAAAVESPA